MSHHYLLQTPHAVLGFAERPTMDSIKARGLGEYTIYRGDGQALKEVLVRRNRNSNLVIVGRTPAPLQAMSTLNLHRLLKHYEKIVKIWPEQSHTVTRLWRQLDRRAELLALVVDTSTSTSTSEPLPVSD